MYGGRELLGQVSEERERGEQEETEEVEKERRERVVGAGE